MARCRVSNPKTLRKLSRIAGFAVVDALTRGGTGHRFDIRDKSGKCWYLWMDGFLEPFEEGFTMGPPGNADATPY